MTLETTLRSMAKPIMVLGTTAYFTLSAVACVGLPAIALPTPALTPTPYAAPAPTATATETATATATVTATPIAGYTDAQLKQMTSSLEEILRANEPALDATGKDYKGYVQKITDNLGAGYFLLTGRTLQQDNISLLPLTKKDFDAFIDKELPYTDDVKADFKKNALSFVWNSRDPTGKKTYSLVMRGDLPVFDIFDSSVHETGLALNEILNPNRQNRTDGSYVLAEAGTQSFKKAVYKTLEDFTGKSLMNYSLNAKNTRYIDTRVAQFQQYLKERVTPDSAVGIGIVALWAAAQENGMLKDGQQMSAKDLYSLFNKLVMDDDTAQKYADGLLARLAATDPKLNFIRNKALSELKQGYPIEAQGPLSIEYSVLRP